MKRRNISNCSQAIAPNVRLVIQSLSPCSGAQDPPIWSIVLNKLSLSLSPRSLARSIQVISPPGGIERKPPPRFLRPGSTTPFYYQSLQDPQY